MWDNLFGQLGQPIAQVLLTRGDISDVRSLSWLLIVFRSDQHLLSARGISMPSTRSKNYSPWA